MMVDLAFLTSVNGITIAYTSSDVNRRFLYFLQGDDMTIAEMNELPRGRSRLFGETVIRVQNGRWYLMDGQEGGFSRPAFEYRSIAALMAAWDITILLEGEDQYSRLYHVRNSILNSR